MGCSERGGDIDSTECFAALQGTGGFYYEAGKGNRDRERDHLQMEEVVSESGYLEEGCGLLRGIRGQFAG